ncbi:MAG: isochorismate synthase, partial [Eggerthellaceae bacterium]|nr:isochorismate synthase [Eggerthellaceae bacterium]
MTRIYSSTVKLPADLLDSFCILQKGFTDQFVYYPKDGSGRYMGLGRCIALASWDDADQVITGQIDQPLISFTFRRFDAENPSPPDEHSAS